MIRTGLIWSGAALVLMLGAVFWAWSQLPAGEPIPVHWNAAGEADNFAPREQAIWYLLILPASALLTTILLALAPSLDPFKGNLKKSEKAYTAIWAVIMALMAALTAGIALGK